MTVPAAGHRVAPHTADAIVEAWGPTRVLCLEQAVAGLVELFADLPDAVVTEPVPLAVEADRDEELLVLLLEEVLYQLEVLGVVPVQVALEETERGGVAGYAHVVPVGTVEEVGAVPKAIARHQLTFAPDDVGVWHARVTVDV